MSNNLLPALHTEHHDEYKCVSWFQTKADWWVKSDQCVRVWSNVLNTLLSAELLHLFIQIQKSICVNKSISVELVFYSLLLYIKEQFTKKKKLIYSPSRRYTFWRIYFRSNDNEFCIKMSSLNKNALICIKVLKTQAL